METSDNSAQMPIDISDVVANYTKLKQHSVTRESHIQIKRSLQIGKKALAEIDVNYVHDISLETIHDSACIMLNRYRLAKPTVGRVLLAMANAMDAFKTTETFIRSMDFSIVRNALSKCTPPPRPRYVRPKVNLAALETLLLSRQDISVRDRCMALAILRCGAKPSEVARMRVSDVKLRGKEVILTNSRGRTRTIKLSDDVVTLFAKHVLNKPRGDDPMWTTRYGKRLCPRAIARIIEATFARAGYRATGGQIRNAMLSASIAHLGANRCASVYGYLHPPKPRRWRADPPQS